MKQSIIQKKIKYFVIADFSALKVFIYADFSALQVFYYIAGFPARFAISLPGHFLSQDLAKEIKKNPVPTDLKRFGRELFSQIFRPYRPRGRGLGLTLPNQYYLSHCHCEGARG